MKKKIFAAMVIAASLSACGGSGGSSDTAGTTNAPLTCPSGQTPNAGGTGCVAVVTPASLQTAVVPNYAVGSDALAAFEAINTFRVSQGLGPLNQNTALDAAAAAHVTYVIDNAATQAPSDYETAGLAGFTGVDPTARAIAQGYAGTGAGEVMSGQITSGTSVIGYGASSVAGLIDTVYHRAILMTQSNTDIGINVTEVNVALSGGFSGISAFDCIDIGQVHPQANASNYFGTYPVNGQTGVGLHAAIETPNPFPSLTTLAQIDAQTGYPISVASAEGTSLSVTTFTVSQAGISLPTTLFTNVGFVAQNQAFIVANAAFLPNTTYTVMFVGSANGAPISQTWTFTTGSGS